MPKSLCHGFRDTSIFMFCDFCKKFENSKWPPFLAGKKICENWVSYSEEVLYGSKISLKSLYLARFSRYKDFFFKNLKIQNGHHFWQVKYLLKLGKASLHRYPVGQKFCRNPTSKFLFYEENGFKKYSYISIILYVYLMSLYFQFCGLHFLSKIQKLNMTPIFGGEFT